MRYSILLLLALILVPSQTAGASDKVVKDSIISQNKKRSFYLFAPDSVNSGTPAPLMVLLHGSGHNGLSLVDKWKDFAAKEAIIIVGPDSMDPSRWASPVDGPDFLHDLVENIEVPGHNHNYYDLASTINQSAWEFLKKHQLNEDPQYEQYNWNK